MKIGLIIYGSLDTLSGGYLYDRKLIEYLHAQGDTVEIISLPWRNYAAHLTDNFYFRLPVNLDILIQDELNHPSLIFANRGKHSYPVIALVHHLRCSEMRPKWQNLFYRWIEKKYLQSVDGFIFNSKTTKKVVNGLMDHGKPSIMAYPPTDRFDGPISENEIIERAKSDELRILFLGNVIYRKGVHTLLEAIARVSRDASRISTYRVDIVGSLNLEPEYSSRIRKMIAENNLSTFVFLHGSLDKELLLEKLKQAHVLVVPSSYEGFGIVYLEGMGFGLPAIGTTVGAAEEIISDGVDGFLIEPGEADLLASRLKSLNERRDVLLKMSLAARSRYLRQPSWEESADRIREFLTKRIDEFIV
ncbi:MAG TPA: glycosyltransferase family 4 protein [Anaerolineales bacterium]|nr:glycosyltransferase family 4 protein [Anaerolineales bacterium]